VFAEVVETPPSGSGAPIEQIVRAELARLSGMSPGAFELASWVVPEPDRRTKSARTLGVAVETAALIETITALTKAGLETVATDLGLLGLLRACRQSMPVPSGGAVIVDLGAAAGRVGIVASDTLVYLRSVPELALAPRVERLAHALGVAITDAHALLFPTQPPGPPGPDRGTASVTAALAADIAKAVITCVSYAAHTNRELDPAIIVLAGGGAELPGLSAAVHAQLDTGCVTLRACSDETAGGVALGPGHANAAAMAAWDQAWTAWATPVSIVKEAA
jgi:Tfp pilus assembly PilM family ATPase